MSDCTVCQRGREACQFCEHVTEGDWCAMCDCGVHDFGVHLTDCESQSTYRYVVACDYDSAVMPRRNTSTTVEASTEPRTDHPY